MTSPWALNGARCALTTVELDDRVAAALAAGASGFVLQDDEIAAELAVSPGTVRTRVGRAMLELHARDRTQLVVFAIGSGLRAPG